MADARFAKPLDEDLVRQLSAHHEVLITIEEGSVGGFGSFVLHYLATNGQLDHSAFNGAVKVRPMVLPDLFFDHDKPERQYEQARLHAAAIVETALAALGNSAIVEGAARA